jgi:hypothetical protein
MEGLGAWWCVRFTGDCLREEGKPCSDDPSFRLSLEQGGQQLVAPALAVIFWKRFKKLCLHGCEGFQIGRCRPIHASSFCELSASCKCFSVGSSPFLVPSGELLGKAFDVMGTNDRLRLCGS